VRGPTSRPPLVRVRPGLLRRQTRIQPKFVRRLRSSFALQPLRRTGQPDRRRSPLPPSHLASHAPSHDAGRPTNSHQLSSRVSTSTESAHSTRFKTPMSARHLVLKAAETASCPIPLETSLTKQEHGEEHDPHRTYTKTKKRHR
jgi:hypothetical protein